MVTSSFEFVLIKASSLQNRAIYRVELQIVLRSRKVKKAESIDMALILGREGDLKQSQL
jgi:hypothetical protein